MQRNTHKCGLADGEHELRFDSLNRPGCSLVIPCDGQGRVDLDGLTDKLRINYLGARAMIGREYAFPVLQRTH